MWTGRQRGHGTRTWVWGFPGLAIIERRYTCPRRWEFSRYGLTWNLVTPWILVWIGREA